VKFINNFELTSAEIGISNNYQYVICGHIRHPEIREISNYEGSIMYLNSGDWIENLSALEYNDGRWSIYRYNDNSFAGTVLMDFIGIQNYTREVVAHSDARPEDCIAIFSGKSLIYCGQITWNKYARRHRERKY
jgi:hypothetical protein